ncbi:hypothetical protein M0804_003684 [Polistes exclamans]|nr:hypothetical protein M0804_003684 [Polistes exclamans]
MAGKTVGEPRALLLVSYHPGERDVDDDDDDHDHDDDDDDDDEDEEKELGEKTIKRTLLILASYSAGHYCWVIIIITDDDDDAGVDYDDDDEATTLWVRR